MSMQKNFNRVLVAVLVMYLSGLDAFAQRRSSKPAPMAASPYVAPTSTVKKLEIASNHTLQAGLQAGGIVSGLSIPTAGSVAFGFTGDVAFSLNDEWQISVPVILVASTSTVFILGAGPQYNWGEGARINQFFANLRPGLAVGGGSSAFVLNSTIGKRFEIIPNVAYRPNFGISFNAAAGEASFDLAPIAISIEL